MRFRRKKKGSSLIFVVIVFMFVMVVSGAMLSMVTGNYAGRVSESNRVHNLYGAESGLDVAYNVIANTIDGANKYGDFYIKTLKNQVNVLRNQSEKTPCKNWEDISTDISINNIMLNQNDVKNLYGLYADIDYWKNYISNGGDDKNDNEIKEEIKKDERDIEKLINIIFKNQFKNFIDNKIKNYVKEGTYVQVNEEETGFTIGENDKVDYKNANISVVDDGNPLVWSKDGVSFEKSQFYIEDIYGTDGKINYEHKSLNISYNNNPIKTNITLNSTFKSTDKPIRIGGNEKNIQVTYVINAPNYDEVLSKNSIIYPVVKDIPGFTVGGNMIVDNSDININGDIFIEGTTPVVTSIDRTYEKYGSGIKINSTNKVGNTINFNDNVYTRETFNIKNNINVNIKGDLYAKNVYAGYTDDDNKNESTQNSKLTVNNPNDSYTQKVVVDNDLAIKAKNTKILIDNFYGISDINGQTGEGVERKSSSIIVNNQKSNSNITIENEAYIAGVAHINTEGDGYQTGESVAVKGNYNAYSVPQSDSDKFEYYNPLQLLEGILPQKSTHFYNYWNDKTGDNSVDCGGVIFLNPKKVKSVGALVYKDSSGEIGVENSYGNIENFQNNLKSLRKEYAWKIYNMSMKKENEILDNDYTNPSSIKNSIGDMINFNADIEGNDSFIFNSNADKTIIITSDSDENNKYDSINGEKEIIRKTNLNAVIVTAGNVTIDGNVNFRGNIITAGNLDISGNGKVNLYYDQTLTKDIQNENLSIFKQVFGDEYGGYDLDSSGDTSTSNGASFLKTKQWRIIK